MSPRPGEKLRLSVASCLRSTPCKHGVKTLPHSACLCHYQERYLTKYYPLILESTQHFYHCSQSYMSILCHFLRKCSYISATNTQVVFESSVLALEMNSCESWKQHVRFINDLNRNRINIAPIRLVALSFFVHMKLKW